MEDWIFGNLNSWLVVTIKNYRLWMRDTKLRKKPDEPSHLSSSLRHSFIFSFNRALENGGLFFRLPTSGRSAQQDHVTRNWSSRKRARGPVTARKGLQSKGPVALRSIPWPKVPFKYLKVCSRANKWKVRGVCINWLRVWTVQEWSGLELIKKFNLPMIVL